MIQGFPDMRNTSSKTGSNGYSASGVKTESMAFGQIAAIAAPIVGDIIGNIGRRKAEREARDYNHPAAQMARLQEAGLNPNLIYGSSPAQAAGTGQAPDYQMNIKSQDILNTQTLRQITAQTQNINAQTRLTDMNAAAVAARMPGLRAESTLAMQKGLAEIGQKTASTDLLKQQVRSAMVDADIKTETKQKEVLRIINQSKLSDLNIVGKELSNRIEKLKADLADDGMSVGDPMLLRMLMTIIPSIKDRLTGKFKEVVEKYNIN